MMSMEAPWTFLNQHNANTMEANGSHVYLSIYLSELAMRKEIEIPVMGEPSL